MTLVVVFLFRSEGLHHERVKKIILCNEAVEILDSYNEPD